MMALLRQGSLWIVNTSSVSSLIKRLQKGDHTGRSTSSSMIQVTANNAQTLLTTIAKQAPAVFRPHVGELLKAIADEKNPRLAEVCLQALAAVSKVEQDVAPTDKYVSPQAVTMSHLNLNFYTFFRRTLDRLMNYARGSEARMAKHATRTLTCTKEKETLCSELIEVCWVVAHYSLANSDMKPSTSPKAYLLLTLICSSHMSQLWSRSYAGSRMRLSGRARSSSRFC